MSELEIPESWDKLEKGDQTSTIAHFITGAEFTREGDEEANDMVIIWEGVEDEYGEEIRLNSHLGNEVPDDARFLVEVHKRGELDQEKFAETLDEAVNQAVRKIAELGA